MTVDDLTPHEEKRLRDKQVRAQLVNHGLLPSRAQRRRMRGYYTSRAARRLAERRAALDD